MRYYGNKTKLLTFIEDAVKKTGINGNSNFVDLFAGTCAVGKHFKQLGYTVISNDNLQFSYALSKAYIELNERPTFTKLCKHLKIGKQSVFEFLNTIENFEAGFIYNNYAPAGGRQYFSNENALRIDTFRSLFETWKRENVVDELEFYYLVTSLLKAVNLVSNVSGTYAAFLKTWDSRALKQLKLEPFEFVASSNANKAYLKDANELIEDLEPDILYLDPPYNNRQYASNYFILELIAEGWFDKEPQIYGETGMRKYEHQKSRYASKTAAEDALRDLIGKSTKSQKIFLSYNNEGFIPTAQIMKILKSIGDCEIIKTSHKRYQSVNQKIDDPKIVLEHLFVVTPHKPKTILPRKAQRANKLTGKEWLQNSFSVWRDLGKNEEERKLGHPAIYTQKLVSKVINTFCPPSKSLILDPFAGSGTTLIGGLQEGHKVIGFDLNPEYRTSFLERAQKVSNITDYSLDECYVTADSRFLSQRLQPEIVDLCITSPPYWDILNRQRTADLKKNKNYSGNVADLGNIEDYELFLEALRVVIQEVFIVLKPKAYFILNVMDLRKGSKFFPLHMDVSKLAEIEGFDLEDIIIWDRQPEYNNMRPLGFPFKFIINKVHEYLLVLRKN